MFLDYLAAPYERKMHFCLLYDALPCIVNSVICFYDVNDAALYKCLVLSDVSSNVFHNVLNAIFFTFLPIKSANDLTRCLSSNNCPFKTVMLYFHGFLVEERITTNFPEAISCLDFFLMVSFLS